MVFSKNRFTCILSALGFSLILLLGACVPQGGKVIVIQASHGAKDQGHDTADAKKVVDCEKEELKEKHDEGHEDHKEHKEHKEDCEKKKPGTTPAKDEHEGEDQEHALRKTMK